MRWRSRARAVVEGDDRAVAVGVDRARAFVAGDDDGD